METVNAAEDAIRVAAALREDWASLNADARVERFRRLGHDEAAVFFLELDTHDQEPLLHGLRPDERRLWVRLLEPDDAADVVQATSAAEREDLLALIDEHTRREVRGLMAYAEDDAGGLMSPRFTSVRPDLTVDEALAYVRRQARENHDATWYVYVLDHGRPIGVVSTRRLLASPPEARISQIMHGGVVTVPAEMDQETLTHLFGRHDLMAIPVVDAEGRMQGIVTVDDIVDVVAEEATEDIQKYGGMVALERPYLDNPFVDTVRKRAGWLAILFVSEMLTTTAMGYFEDEIRNAVVLALFVPLIISSGGNSGSQASTLVIRAMALEEVRLRDWWRVCRREIGAGLTLGAVLGAIGFGRVLLWNALFGSYADDGPVRVALTVCISLVGVVLFGTLAGSMLPFVLRKLGLDPASASAPFVATLVDVTGLVIYFSVASVFLSHLMV